MKVAYLALLLGLHCALAYAGTLEVLGQQINYTVPDGYCAVGETQRERELLDQARRAVGPSIRLLHMAVSCSELKAFATGKRDYLDHWLQVQLVGPKGIFKRLEIGKEAYLSAISKFSPQLDLTEVNRRMESIFANQAVSIGEPQIVPLGRDGNAAYFAGRMTLTMGADSRLITTFGAMTLVNSLPLNFWIYEATGEARDRELMRRDLRQMLTSVFAGN